MPKIVEKILISMRQGPDGPARASEGSAIELADGRILYVYTHFMQTAHDLDVSDLRAVVSKDAEGSDWSDPFVVVPNDARLNTMSASLARLGKGGLDAAQGGISFALAGTAGGPLGLTYMKHEYKHTNAVYFRLSRDEGRTWSREVRVNPVPTYEHFGMNNDTLVVLSTGRIVVPVHGALGGLWGSFVYYSDDEGCTWLRGEDDVLIRQRGPGVEGRPGPLCSAAHFEEPNIVELKDGRVMMFGRNMTGRIWKCYSPDGCRTWSEPEPTDVATSYSPVSLKRVPSTGDLLLVWNHVSMEEIRAGWGRMRMSCAVSHDEGQTWGHFKNLDSLDDVGRIEPPTATGALDAASEIQAIASRLWKVEGRRTPDPERYPRAESGHWHVDYPSLAFTRDARAVITYGVYGGPKGKTLADCGTKLWVLPVEWFTR